MPIKTALLTAFTVVMLQFSGTGLSVAESLDHAAVSLTTDPEITGALPPKQAVQGISTPDLLHQGQGSADDIVGARGPNIHASELSQIAIYASIGNADGVAMLTGQLRDSGVSHETIRRAINRMNVHGSALSPPVLRLGRSHSQADAGWQATQ